MELGKFNLEQLGKKAIKVALDQDWESAVTINAAILKESPDSLKAKIRLGNAYLRIKKFKNAEKLFKQVLEVDPINKVAVKNLKLAKEKTAKSNTAVSTTLIHKPGTILESTLFIENKNYTSENFDKGEELGIKITKKEVKIYKTIKGKEGEVGKITSKTVEQLSKAKNAGAKITTTFQKGNGKEIKVLFTADKQVFKAKKQEIKPYVKKGLIEESELVIPESNR